jgi:hypothetical protein
MRLVRFLFLLLFPVVFLLPSFAQTDAFSEAGTKPYGAFHAGDIDSVSMVNGKLNLHIPLASFPQRGGKLKLDFWLSYFNPVLEEAQICIPSKPCVYQSVWSGNGVGVSYSMGYLTSVVGSTPPDFTTYAIISPDGSQHTLGLTGSGNYESLDATGLRYNSSTNVMSDESGIQYTFQTGGGGRSPALIQDTNGNEISFSGTSWEDTMGRTIPLPPVNSTPGNTTDYSYCTGTLPITQAFNWTIPTVSGGQAAIKFCYASVPMNFNLDGSACNTTGSYLAYNSSSILLQSVVLPNNTAYTFQYSSSSISNCHTRAATARSQ